MALTEIKRKERPGSLPSEADPGGEKAARRSFSPGFTFDWWAQSHNTAAVAAYEVCRRINNLQVVRRHDMWRHILLYGGIKPQDYITFGMLGFGTDEGYSTTNTNVRLKLNIIKQGIDTMTAMVTKQDVKATFLTSDGDWGMRQKAMKLDRFGEGVFYHNKMRELAPLIFRDACLMEKGFVKVFCRDDDVVLERTLPFEILVDHWDGRYGDPSTLYQKRWVEKERLYEQFKDNPDAIRAIKSASMDFWDGDYAQDQLKIVDLVLVVEAWKLPSGPKAKDGMHCMAINNAGLVCEPWEHRGFPFGTMNLDPRILGYWGHSVVETLIPHQKSINQQLMVMEETLALGTPQIWMQKGSTIAKGHLTQNQILQIIEFVGEKPEFWAGAPFNEQLMEVLRMRVDAAYESIGIPRGDSRGEKPPDVESAVAIRASRDISTERLAVINKRFEDFHLATETIAIEQAVAYHKAGGRIIVQSPGIYGYQEITSDDIADLERKDYPIKVYPTNLLPSTPEGKLATLTDMVTAGLFTPQDAKRLLNYPDLEAVNSLENTPVEVVLAEIDYLRQGKPYRPPEPFFVSTDAIKMFQWSYCKYRMWGAPQELLENLILWINQASAMLAGPAAGQPIGPPASPVVPPPGAGAPAPVSPLVPQQGLSPQGAPPPQQAAA